MRAPASSSPPPPCAVEIARPGALAALDRARPAAVAYVVGPPGSAKTTTVAQWCRGIDDATVVWIDAAGAGSSTALAAATEAASVGERRVVVVDLADGSAPPDIEPLVAVRADHGDVHVVIISRSPLPDASAVHVARGRLHHVDAERFTLDRAETAALAARVGVTDLTGEEVVTLVERTEGWPAGIAMSLRRVLAERGRPGQRVLVDHDLIGAYLRSEVLDRIDDHEVAVLELAAVVGSVHPRLVDHALGRPVGADRLERLRRRGCFVRAAGRGGPWTTFHPLLLDEIATGGGGDPDVLRRAASWLSDQGLALEAARCLTHLRDWDGAGALVQAHLPSLLAQDRFGELRTFLSEVPGHVMREHTPWALGHAGLELMAGRLAACLETLAVIEPWLTPSRRMMMLGMRASTVAFVSDPAPCIDQAFEALTICDQLGEDFRFSDMYTVSRTDHYRARIESCLVLAAVYDGRWDLAERAFRPVRSATAAELPALAWRAVLGRRASYLALAGRVPEAERDLEGVRRIDRDGHDFVVLEPGQAEVAGAEVRRARGDLAGAEEALTEVLADAGARARRNTWAWAVVSLANVLVDRREPGRAVHELRGFADVPGDPPAPLLRGMAAAVEARGRLALGDLAGARAAVETAPPVAEVHAQRVAIELAAGDVSVARTVLDAWTPDPTPAGVVRRHLAEAAVLEATGAARRAERELRLALDVAAGANLVQPFIEQGLVVLRPLRRVAAVVDGAEGRVTAAALALLEPTGSSGLALTPKEALVLGHLGRDQTIGALAAELHLSVNTMKSHLASIYRKLGVNSRAAALEAVRRAPR